MGSGKDLSGPVGGFRRAAGPYNPKRVQIHVFRRDRWRLSLVWAARNLCPGDAELGAIRQAKQFHRPAGLPLTGIGGQADGAEEYQPASSTIYEVRLFRASLIDCERGGGTAFRATNDREAAIE